MLYFNELEIIGRKDNLFEYDIKKYEKEMNEIINQNKFLVIGGAGSIGSSVVKEIFKRNPKKLHVIDISENNLVELVRDIRSSLGYIEGEFKTFVMDSYSYIFNKFFQNEDYDYVLNLSALKHVRSEKDPYTLMRMIDINILNSNSILEKSIEKNVKKYFCVSTDKAANPVNMMGASKRIMEYFLTKYSNEINISTARFANVAFSDGSLLYSFKRRIEKLQPIVSPKDIKRYFVTLEESGQLCLMSTLFGNNIDIYFPKLNENFKLTYLSDIALKFIEYLGYEPYICNTEEEARKNVENLVKEKKYPIYLFDTDTSGEKDYEEFFTDNEELDLNTYKTIGIIKNNNWKYPNERLDYFLYRINEIKKSNIWNKKELVELFNFMIPEFNHLEKGKNLDEKM